MHQSHLDFIKQRMCGLLSLLLPLENLATDVPQLGKDSVQRIVKSMTLEEKASLLVGLSMEDYGGEGSVAGHTLRVIFPARRERPPRCPDMGFRRRLWPTARPDCGLIPYEKAIR